MKLPRIRSDIRQYIRHFSRDSMADLSEEEIQNLSEVAAKETEEMVEQQETDLNMNKSFGTLISDPSVQPFEEMDATIGEIQEDVNTLENFLEELGDELEMQEREYERITDAPEEESRTARELRAHRANKERLMYKAKLEAFEDIRQRLKRKVRLLSEMVRKVISRQTDQNYDVQENLDQVEGALAARERESISEGRELNRIDDRLNAMQDAGDMSVQKDMQVIEEKSGASTNRQTELSRLADEVLGDEDEEQSDKASNRGDD